MMILVALMAMVGATLAQHLGLTEAIVRILLKVARCPKCCSFWVSWIVLVLAGCDLFIAIMLALAMAYLSHWFGIGLYLLNQLYSRIWERLKTR